MTVFRPTLPIVASMVCCVTATGLAGELIPSGLRHATPIIIRTASGNERSNCK